MPTPTICPLISVLDCTSARTKLELVDGKFKSYSNADDPPFSHEISHYHMEIPTRRLRIRTFAFPINGEMTEVCLYVSMLFHGKPTFSSERLCNRVIVPR